MRKALVFSVTLLATLSSVILFHDPVSATTANFKAGEIMSDTVMTSAKAMSASQIQSFLNSKVTTCDTNGNETSPYGGSDLNHDGRVTRAEWAKGKYNQTKFVCLKDYVKNGKKASQIIYDIAQKYTINPQTLIVLLQKEQGLVTDTWPLNVQYRTATGYGCPDTAPCDSEYYGLTNQLDWAAKMYRSIIDQNPDWYSPYFKGTNPQVFWHPDTGRCGSNPLDIKNWTTASLYSYTPYRPNQAALDAGYGTGNSCSAYGNRNFYSYFTDWFGSTVTQPNMRLITCDENHYIVERFISQKRLVTDEAMASWKFTEEMFKTNDSGCSYPNYDVPLGNIIRSRSSEKVYLIDEGRAYQVDSQAVANAWGLGTIASDAYPQLDPDSITQAIPRTITKLPRLATSTNPDRDDVYLIDNQKRYLIAGTNADDTASLRLINGDDEVPTATVSVPLLQTLVSSGTIDYSFKIGSDTYLLDHNMSRKVDEDSKANWNTLTAGPTLTSGVLSLFKDNKSIGTSFERESYHYRLLDNKKIERTTDDKIGTNWKDGSNPTITNLLTTKILADTTGTTTMTTANTIRLIVCGGSKYLVEPSIRSKRPINQTGIDAWNFTNKYFFVNDKGCQYPSYSAPIGNMIRSRSSDKVYYVDNQTAYSVQNQEAADEWGFGDYKHNSYPQFNSKSISGNLDTVNELPPHS